MFLLLSLFSFCLFPISSSIFQYFNYPRTQPLPCHCVLYLILVCSQGHITPLIMGQNRQLPSTRTWPKSPKSSVSPVGVNTSPKLQNPNSSFAIPKVLPKILNATYVNHDEVLYEILNSTTIYFDEIVELSNSQFDPQVDPPWKKQKFVVDGIGKKPCKESYDSSKKNLSRMGSKITMGQGVNCCWWDYPDYEV